MNTEHTEPGQPAKDGLPQLLTEDQAADLLGIKNVTVRNMVYNGKIPADHYTTAVNGQRYYFRDKLLGLDK
jgi:excisionase family DNA binding protein